MAHPRVLTVARNLPLGDVFSCVSLLGSEWGSNGTEREAHCVRESACNALATCKVLPYSLPPLQQLCRLSDCVPRSPRDHLRRIRDPPPSDKASSLLSVFYVRPPGQVSFVERALQYQQCLEATDEEGFLPMRISSSVC